MKQAGRPLHQRNVLRELRRAMKAAGDDKGRPTFPVLHQEAQAPRGSVPNFDSFRHTAPSPLATLEEGSWQLGHKNSDVTRGV